MWYHYILIVAGLYLVGSAIYTLVTGARGTVSYVLNGLQIAIGLGVGYYGYSGVTAPAPTMLPAAVAPAVNTMMGGMRRVMKGKW